MHDLHSQLGWKLGQQLTSVNSLGWASEVEVKAEAVGKHGQRASCLLVPCDFIHVAQPLAMQLRSAAAHINADLYTQGGQSHPGPRLSMKLD